jgi:hypothetical protein
VATSSGHPFCRSFAANSDVLRGAIAN